MKPASDFYLGNGGKLRSWCKACMAEDTAARKARDPETARAKARESTRQWQERNPNAGREYYQRKRAEDPEGTRLLARDRKRRWYAENPERVKADNDRRKAYRDDWRLRKRYGISMEEYTVMLNKQNGGCAICGEECRTGSLLAVDHDHETGRIRGLLCRPCNSAIGLLLDSPELLQRAVQYLQRQAEENAS